MELQNYNYSGNANDLTDEEAEVLLELELSLFSKALATELRRV